MCLKQVAIKDEGFGKSDKPGRLSTSHRFRPAKIGRTGVSTGVHCDRSSQLLGGGGPAGNLRPLASIRLLTRARGLGVSGRSRSRLISEGMLGMMTGAARCPFEDILEARKALRSSVTLGDSLLPFQTIRCVA